MVGSAAREAGLKADIADWTATEKHMTKEYQKVAPRLLRRW